jgi:hypothetical protein
MRHLKLFEAFVGRSPSYKTPEYEFKEFYRAFKNYPELRNMLPATVDQRVFKIKDDGFDGEPAWLDAHVDPPSRSGEINTEKLLKIAEDKDPRFVPLIQFCQQLFESGRMKKIPLDFMTPKLSTTFKGHDWDILEKSPDHLKKCEAEYKKALAVGLDDEKISGTLGLVQKYPEINISQAQFWIYIKGSIAHFDRTVEEGKEIPCTQFILHDGKYYTIGGRRRMFWHFYNKMDPTVWVIE